MGIRELCNNALRVIEQVTHGERVLVTKRNRPVAVILSIDEALDFVLAYSEEFVRMRIEAREDHDAGRSVGLD